MLALRLVSLAILAANPTPPKGVEEIVVTASRDAAPLEETLATVDVIDREAILRSGARDLGELLERRAGIDVMRSGGAGEATSLFLRGTNSDQLVVLLDGVRIDSALTGTADWAAIAPTMLERVEIVRGPRAAFYGSDAVGGVIQLFSHEPQRTAGRLTAASYGTRAASLGAGAAVGPAEVAFAGELRASDGFSAQSPAGWSYDPDADGYATTSLGGHLRLPLAGHTLSVGGFHARHRSDFDVGTSDSLLETATLQLEGELAPTWRHALSAGYVFERLSTDSVPATRLGSETLSLSWLHAVRVAPSLDVHVGLDWRERRGHLRDIDAASPIVDAAERQAGLFASVETTLARTRLQGTGRLDWLGDLGWHPTGQLALESPAWHGLRAWAGGGTSYRVPSLSQRYHPGYFGYFAGNPDLRPERAESVELGLRHTAGSVRTELVAYATRVRDLVAFEGVQSQAINIGEASMRGLELQAEGGDRLAWRLAGTWQRAIDARTEQALLRRPRLKGDATLSYRAIDPVSVGAELHAVGPHADISPRTFERTKTRGYALVALFAHVVLTDAVVLRARADNLLGASYTVIPGYQTPGRVFWVALDVAAAP